MARILVVDDEHDLEVLIKQKFRQKIREQAYEFHFAGNGMEALEKLEEVHDIDLVLSDINMPEMDGLTLLSKISDLKPLMKTVIVSAYGDMDNIRTAMNRGAYDFVTKPINFEDLTITVEKTLRQVEQIKKSLAAIRENNILKMYVDQNVLNFMNSHEFESSLMANETIEASVVFVDICGFTSISENVPADVVVNLLNSYFDSMVKEILAQGGYVDKFIGDAIMAVFRGDYHLDRAIDSSLGLRAEIQKLPLFTDNVNFTPQVSIGINSGEMVSGNIGSSSLRRLDFTVIGDAVNTAQRLQSIAKPDQILIPEHCYEAIKHSFECREAGTFSLKNKASHLVVYEVIS